MAGIRQQSALSDNKVFVDFVVGYYPSLTDKVRMDYLFIIG
jgi:hypothetical protein